MTPKNPPFLAVLIAWSIFLTGLPWLLFLVGFMLKMYWHYAVAVLRPLWR